MGSVPEGLFTHLIMVPFGLKDQGLAGEIRPGKGRVQRPGHRGGAGNESGEEKELTMVFSWPSEAAHPLL